MSSNENSNVRLLQERPYALQPGSTAGAAMTSAGAAPPVPSSGSNSTASKSDFLGQCLVVMTALLTTVGALLAVRMILLLAMLGATLLAYLAMTEPSPTKVATLISYAVLVVCPLVLLYFKRG